MERKKLTYMVWLTQSDKADFDKLSCSGDMQKVLLKHYMINLLGVDFVIKWLNDKRSRFWKVKHLLLMVNFGLKLLQ